MRQTSGALGFFLNVGLIAVFVTLGVYQVPQPWRGVLVALLLVGLTVGFFVLRVVGNHQNHEGSAGGRRRPPQRSLPKRQSQGSRSSTQLDVVRLNDRAQGRHTVG